MISLAGDKKRSPGRFRHVHDRVNKVNRVNDNNEYDDYLMITCTCGMQIPNAMHTMNRAGYRALVKLNISF